MKAKQKISILLVLVLSVTTLSSGADSFTCPDGYTYSDTGCIPCEGDCSSSSFARKSGTHEDLASYPSAITGSTAGHYVIFKPAGTNAGTATVSVKFLGSVIYSKTYDQSEVGWAAPDIYNISYNANFNVNGIGSYDVTDGREVKW